MSHVALALEDQEDTLELRVATPHAGCSTRGWLRDHRGEAAESMLSAPSANTPTRPRVGALVVKNPLYMRTVPWTAGWAAPRQTRRLLFEAPTRRSGLVGAAPGARGRSRGRPAVGVLKTPGSQGSTGGQLWRGIVKPFKVLVQLVRGYQSLQGLRWRTRVLGSRRGDEAVRVSICGWREGAPRATLGHGGVLDDVMSAHCACFIDMRH
jgi:hypothetical protein